MIKSYSGLLKCLFLFLVVPIAVWIFSISKTVEQYKQNQNIKILNNQIIPVKNELTPTIKVEKSFISSGYIIESINEILRNLKITVISYTPYLTDFEDDLYLYSGVMELTGSFVDLVKILSDIEKLPVKVISAKFQTQYQQRDRSEKLVLTLILQQVEISAIKIQQ